MNGNRGREKEPMPGPPGPGPGGGPPGFFAGTEKARDFKGTLKKLYLYLKPYNTQIFIVALFAILSTVFAIVGPKMMGWITTELFEGLMAKYMSVSLKKPMPSINFVYIGKTTMLLIVLYLVSGFFSYMQQYIMAGVSQKIVFDMRRDVNDKFSRLPLKYFDSKTHGEIMSRVINDIDNVSNSLQQSMTQLITSIATIIGVLVMMLTISPLLTLISIITLPVSVLFTKGVAKLSQKNYLAQSVEIGALNGHVEEMYTGHKIVKAFGHERKSISEFRKINRRLYAAGWKAQFISGIIMPMMNFITNIGYVLVCVAGGIMVTKNKLDLGDIQAFIQYTRQFTMPITMTANIFNILQLTVVSAERVFDVLEETEEIPEKDNAGLVSHPRGEVKFHNVTFGYREDTLLMKDLNIHVKKGQMIAIVGPTGAGKTTLVNLLMRFYEINAGKITIDNVDIRDMKRSELRSMLGMVLQDTWLFNGTIRENIAYGRDGAVFEEIVEAARAAHADHFIRALPDGYNTVLNEEASNISQGEKQLLTIARAILSDPAILILDEATSSVDTRTEVNIQKAMKVLMEGRTSFVIAHRLSTIRDAELILVMNNGSIIEMGNHMKLLAKGGFYADLYNSQFVGAYTDN